MHDAQLRPVLVLNLMGSTPNSRHDDAHCLLQLLVHVPSLVVLGVCPCEMTASDPTHIRVQCHCMSAAAT